MRGIVGFQLRNRFVGLQEEFLDLWRIKRDPLILYGANLETLLATPVENISLAEDVHKQDLWSEFFEDGVEYPLKMQWDLDKLNLKNKIKLRETTEVFNENVSFLPDEQKIIESTKLTDEDRYPNDPRATYESGIHGAMERLRQTSEKVEPSTTIKVDEDDKRQYQEIQQQTETISLLSDDEQTNTVSNMQTYGQYENENVNDYNYSNTNYGNANYSTSTDNGNMSGMQDNTTLNNVSAGLGNTSEILAKKSLDLLHRLVTHECGNDNFVDFDDNDSLRNLLFTKNVWQDLIHLGGEHRIYFMSHHEGVQSGIHTCADKKLLLAYWKDVIQNSKYVSNDWSKLWTKEYEQGNVKYCELLLEGFGTMYPIEFGKNWGPKDLVTSDTTPNTPKKTPLPKKNARNRRSSSNTSNSSATVSWNSLRAGLNYMLVFLKKYNCVYSTTKHCDSIAIGRDWSLLPGDVIYMASHPQLNYRLKVLKVNFDECVVVSDEGWNGEQHSITVEEVCNNDGKLLQYDFAGCRWALYSNNSIVFISKRQDYARVQTSQTGLVTLYDHNNNSQILAMHEWAGVRMVLNYGNHDILLRQTHDPRIDYTDQCVFLHEICENDEMKSNNNNTNLTVVTLQNQDCVTVKFGEGELKEDNGDMFSLTDWLDCVFLSRGESKTRPTMTTAPAKERSVWFNNIHSGEVPDCGGKAERFDEECVTLIEAVDMLHKLMRNTKAQINEEETVKEQIERVTGVKLAFECKLPVKRVPDIVIKQFHNLSYDKDWSRLDEMNFTNPLYLLQALYCGTYDGILPDNSDEKSLSKDETQKTMVSQKQFLNILRLISVKHMRTNIFFNYLSSVIKEPNVMAENSSVKLCETMFKNLMDLDETEKNEKKQFYLENVQTYRQQKQRLKANEVATTVWDNNKTIDLTELKIEVGSLLFGVNSQSSECLLRHPLLLSSKEFMIVETLDDLCTTERVPEFLFSIGIRWDWCGIYDDFEEIRLLMEMIGQSSDNWKLCFKQNISKGDLQQIENNYVLMLNTMYLQYLLCNADQKETEVVNMDKYVWNWHCYLTSNPTLLGDYMRYFFDGDLCVLHIILFRFAKHNHNVKLPRHLTKDNGDQSHSQLTTTNNSNYSMFEKALLSMNLCETILAVLSDLSKFLQIKQDILSKVNDMIKARTVYKILKNVNPQQSKQIEQWFNANVLSDSKKSEWWCMVIITAWLEWLSIKILAVVTNTIQPDQNALNKKQFFDYICPNGELDATHWEEKRDTVMKYRKEHNMSEWFEFASEGKLKKLAQQTSLLQNNDKEEQDNDLTEEDRKKKLLNTPNSKSTSNSGKAKTSVKNTKSQKEKTPVNSNQRLSNTKEMKQVNNESSKSKRNVKNPSKNKSGCKPPHNLPNSKDQSPDGDRQGATKEKDDETPAVIVKATVVHQSKSNKNSHSSTTGQSQANVVMNPNQMQASSAPPPPSVNASSSTVVPTQVSASSASPTIPAGKKHNVSKVGGVGQPKPVTKIRNIVLGKQHEQSLQATNARNQSRLKADSQEPNLLKQQPTAVKDAVKFEYPMQKVYNGSGFIPVTVGMKVNWRQERFVGSLMTVTGTVVDNQGTFFVQCKQNNKQFNIPACNLGVGKTVLLRLVQRGGWYPANMNQRIQIVWKWKHWKDPDNSTKACEPFHVHLQKNQCLNEYGTLKGMCIHSQSKIILAKVEVQGDKGIYEVPSIWCKPHEDWSPSDPETWISIDSTDKENFVIPALDGTIDNETVIDATPIYVRDNLLDLNLVKIKIGDTIYCFNSGLSGVALNVLKFEDDLDGQIICCQSKHDGSIQHVAADCVVMHGESVMCVWDPVDEGFVPMAIGSQVQFNNEACEVKGGMYDSQHNSWHVELSNENEQSFWTYNTFLSTSIEYCWSKLCSKWIYCQQENVPQMDGDNQAISSEASPTPPQRSPSPPPPLPPPVVSVPRNRGHALRQLTRDLSRNSEDIRTLVNEVQTHGIEFVKYSPNSRFNEVGVFTEASTSEQI